MIKKYYIHIICIHNLIYIHNHCKRIDLSSLFSYQHRILKIFCDFKEQLTERAISFLYVRCFRGLGTIGFGITEECYF